MGRADPELRGLKKLRNRVKDPSERVDTVEETCSEVKRDNVATSAELARLKKRVSKLEPGREGDNAGVRKDLRGLRAKVAFVMGLLYTFLIIVIRDGSAKTFSHRIRTFF